MIYSHKSAVRPHNLSAVEKRKLNKLRRTKSTAWMIEKNCDLN